MTKNEWKWWYRLYRTYAGHLGMASALIRIDRTDSQAATILADVVCVL